MIKIYLNQEKPNVIFSVENAATNKTEWWMIYNASTLEIIILPQQCSGKTSSPYTMVIADTEEQLNQYIIENGLVLPHD
jgi:hypothetical protein